MLEPEAHESEAQAIELEAHSDEDMFLEEEEDGNIEDKSEEEEECVLLGGKFTEMIIYWGYFYGKILGLLLHISYSDPSINKDQKGIVLIKPFSLAICCLIAIALYFW